MAISYPLSVPNTTSVKSVTMRARSNVAVTQSPFTYKQQVLKFQGSAWEIDVSLKAMKRDEAEEWIAFFLKLNGQYGTFYAADPNGLTARGSASTTPGTPVVNGSNQTGTDLEVSGLPASTTGYLKAGDYIQLGTGASSKLHKVLNNVNTTAAGEATMTLYPEIKVAPNSGDTIIVDNAQGVFRLSSNETDWNIQTNLFYGLTFGAVEAI